MKGFFQLLVLLMLAACIVLNIITLKKVSQNKEAAKHQIESLSGATDGPYHGATCGSCTEALPPIPGTGGPGQRGEIKCGNLYSMPQNKKHPHYSHLAEPGNPGGPLRGY